ncbi:unnamed protein product [Cylindrotheca closterium]|uniref:Uncharacterized protein n=1 Tax=Cylindrotheca closterium TaxID=2856 RepID=A0AAD2G201_9STRA|nr:unnamed protein product [Cylindrotheca closterium]
MSLQQHVAKRQKTTENVPIVNFVYKGRPKINIPAGVSHVTTSQRVRKIKEEYFLYCRTLRFLSIGQSVQEIERSAFQGCTYLTTVELQEGIKIISSGAFRGCTSLLEIDVPKTVETIERDGFQGCAALKHVRCHYDEGLLDDIGDRAFMNCSSLVDVTLPQEVTYFGEEVFKNCTSLCAVAWPECEHIPSDTFKGCTSLVGVEIPVIDGLYIAESAFTGCAHLINIWVPAYYSRPSDLFSFFIFLSCERMMIPGEDGQDRFVNRLQRIRDRYTNLPVHMVCYYSSLATVEELVEVFNTENALKEENIQDCHGLTPFHVVAASANLRIDLFQCLVDHYPIEVLERKDKNGQMMMEYLIEHKSSHAVPLVKLAIQKLAMDRFNMQRLGQSKEAELLRRFELIRSDNDTVTRMEHFDSFKKFARYCVMTATTSLIELALWKMKMNRGQKEDLEADDTSRTDCRCQCGADIVIGNVFGYLCKSRSDLFSDGHDERYSTSAVC